MLDLLMKRRSVRKYLDKEIEEDKIDKIIDIALTSPSSNNLRPWNFIVIKDKDRLLELSESRGQDSRFMNTARLGIAVIIDPDKSPTYLIDGSILALYIQLAGQSMGISSCWIQAHDRFADDGSNMEDNIKKILGVPKRYRVLCLLSMGYQAKDRSPHLKEDLLYERIHHNQFKKEVDHD